MICSKCEYDDEDVGLAMMYGWIKKNAEDIICQKCVENTKGYVFCKTCSHAGHEKFFKYLGLLPYEYPNGTIDYFKAWQCQTCYEDKVPWEDEE